MLCCAGLLEAAALLAVAPFASCGGGGNDTATDYTPSPSSSSTPAASSSVSSTPTSTPRPRLDHSSVSWCGGGGQPCHSRLDCGLTASHQPHSWRRRAKMREQREKGATSALTGGE